MKKKELENIIDAARGKIKADIVIKNGKIFDLISGKLRNSEVAIFGNKIIGIDENYKAHETINAKNKIIVPGFIDTHLHIESSMVTPFEFEKFVLPKGVTTAICDPHEIANVLGIEGIKYFIKASEKMIMNLFVKLSSCVPSSPLETSGAAIDSTELKKLVTEKNVIGLAEMMNYPGVLNKDSEVIEKLLKFSNYHIDGHSPLLSGKDLNAYISSGIITEHEATSLEEGREKLEKGMRLLIREGSVSKDLKSLSPLINERFSPFIAFCTDDRNPLDIIEKGHIDHIIRSAIKYGADILSVYRASSYSAARSFNLNDIGLIAPGYKANLAILDSLEKCNAETVICNGKIITNDLFKKIKNLKPIGIKSVKAKKTSVLDFKYEIKSKTIDVIEIIPGKIITNHLKLKIANKNEISFPDIKKDIAKISVIERHGKNNNISNAFVRGFGFKQGAIASTVCHDHHNIVVAGVSEKDMVISSNRLRDIRGGFVVANNEKILAELALPIAGLMSNKPFMEVYKELIILRDAAKSLGIILEEPFLQLAFLALPVIPHLKITDKGLVDVNKFKLI
tara:strand:+ start:1120 stop:2817 length:1698 start_codon:yes stop_codon:yes gene_type:complete